MQIKKFWKTFVFLFLLFFLIFNWNQISWIFNYQAVSGVFSELFKSDPKRVEEKEVFEKIEESLEQERKGNIVIPKIGISAPLIFTQSSDQGEIEYSLDLGVVHFFDSGLPGESGQTIFLGHSAPPGWPKIKYDWVFTDLNKLVEGDEVYINFNDRQFKYSVKQKYFLERGEELPEYLEGSGSVLFLISCWPPGKDLRRIALEARLE